MPVEHLVLLNLKRTKVSVDVCFMVFVILFLKIVSSSSLISSASSPGKLSAKPPNFGAEGFRHFVAS